MSSHFSTLDQIRKPRAALQPVAPISSAAPWQPFQSVMPARPEAIPSLAEERSPAVRPFLQPKLAVGPVDHPLEGEADRMAAQVVSSGLGMGAGIDESTAAHEPHRQAAGDGAAPRSAPDEGPVEVNRAFDSPGKPLDSATQAYMEPRFGADLADVRVHTGAESAAAAQAVDAHAYTVGSDIFFGSSRYDPQSREGLRLLAHEVSHTVQQSGGSAGKQLSGAAPGVYRDPQGTAKPAAQGTSADTETKKTKTDQVTVPVPPALLQNLQLTPPSLLAPPQQPPLLSPGKYSLGGSAAGASPSQSSPTSPPVLPPAAQYTPYGPSPLAPASQPNPSLLPAGGAPGSAAPTVSPKAPDRVSLHDFGSLSIGARFGFPSLAKDSKPGDPPSALQQSIQQAEVLNFIFNGTPPSAYSVDPGKLVGALWGIFSTQIAPGVASKIAAGLSSKPAGGGPSFQLDATILLNIGSGSGPSATKTGGGGGATLTVVF